MLCERNVERVIDGQTTQFAFYRPLGNSLFIIAVL